MYDINCIKKNIETGSKNIFEISPNPDPRHHCLLAPEITLQHLILT